MKLGGRRLVARRHSGVDAGVCGDEYRQIRPGVAGSCIALACDRRRGGGRGVSPPWRRSAGASVTAIVRQSPATIFLKNHLKIETRRYSSISRILDFSRRLTIVFKRPSCELVHQEWLTTARGHTVASCDERGLACAAHTDVVYIHICGHVSAGSGHGFRIFPWPNNRCCSGANGRLPSRHWHPSQQ